VAVVSPDRCCGQLEANSPAETASRESDSRHCTFQTISR
jgi:hypothetical protein